MAADPDRRAQDLTPPSWAPPSIFGWGGQDVTEYFYYGNFAAAFGEGPAVDVLRLWAGSKLIFDRRDPVAAMPEGWSGAPATLFTGNSKYKYKIHLGTEDQEPDGLIVRKGVGGDGEADAVPAHRGLVYIVFDRLPLAEWNNRIPPITAEIAWSGARPATVRNASFLPHDGGTTFQRPGMAVDFARGYIYLEGNGGMHRIRTRDMQEDLHVTEAQMGAEQQRGEDGESNVLSFEAFPHAALVKTYAHDAQVPDSAPTAPR